MGTTIREEIWLDASCVEAANATVPMTVEHLPPSLHRFYKQDLRLWIVRAEDRVTFAKALGWCPASLPFIAGQSVGYVERLAWPQAPEKAQVAVEFSRTWHDPIGVRYVSRLK